MSHPGHARCATCGGSIFRENATTNVWHHLDSGVTAEPPCVQPTPEVTL